MKNLFAIVFTILSHQFLVGQSSLIRDLNVQADFQPSIICENQLTTCTVTIMNNNWTGGTGSKDTLYAGSVAVQLNWTNRTHALNIVPTGGTLASKFTWTYYPTDTGGYAHGGWYGVSNQNIVDNSGSIEFVTSGQHNSNNAHGAHINLLMLAPFGDNNTHDNTTEPLITVLHSCNLTLTCKETVTYNVSNGELTTTTVVNSINSDGAIAGYFLSKNTWTCMDIGTVTFTTLTVTDTAGNVSSCTAHVTVSDTVTPLVTCTAVIHYNVGGMDLVTATAHSHISDNCTVTPATFLSQTGGWGCADKGNHTITLTVDDGNGNVTSCTLQVTVSDTVGPNLVCNATTTYDISGPPLTTPTVLVSATDNCGIMGYILSKDTWMCTDIGTVTYTTLTVTDTSGNVSKCTVQVTVTGTTGTVTTTATACDSYTWSANGQTYTVSGTYSSVTGCTTNVLVLTIVTSTTVTTTATACDSYTWNANGQTYTVSGTYISVTGCTTNVLVLTIVTSTTVTTTATACDSYSWNVNGQTYTVGGTYTSVSNCTTNVLLLTIVTSTTVTTTATACDSYIWGANGQTYSVSGTYSSVSGCTTNELVLTIITSFANNVTIDYTGVSVLSTSTNSAQITLSAVVTLPIGADVTKSELRFINRDNGLPISGWFAIRAGAQPNKGSASYQHTLNLGLNEIYRKHTIGFEVGGTNSCFNRNNTADDIAVIHAKSSCGCH